MLGWSQENVAAKYMGKQDLQVKSCEWVISASWPEGKQVMKITAPHIQGNREEKGGLAEQ